MNSTKNGYVSGAVLLMKFSRKLREHVEFEKYMARVLVDNETTQEFKKNTDNLKDKIHAFRYNNDAANKLTAAGRKDNGGT